MYRDRDVDPERELPPHEEALTQDLELTILFGAMAGGDHFLYEVARAAVLSSLTDPDEIVYRQDVLSDCLAHPSIVREIYGIATDATQAERRIYLSSYMFRDTPNTMLSRAVRVLEFFVGILRQLRTIADEHAGKFRSDGFVRFFAMLEEELDDEYLATIEEHLDELKFRRGLLISAELGEGNRGVRHVLRRAPAPRWIERISRRGGSAYTFTVHSRDDSGLKALSELRGKGINLAANALTQSTDHILSFFTVLRAELAFYVACLNLNARLVEKGGPTCFPVPVAPGGNAFATRGLYEACLALKLEAGAVGNDVNANGRRLVMITGANQGGKSTFLRSVGVAQLMMQCGMVVAADSFRADVCHGVFTHYKREEDAGMTSGKLDEELSRMSEIADDITPNCLLLCNESFAATNEREGSEIARQVVRALTEAGVKVFFVTHLFDLAHGFYRQGMDAALFLRAERQADGRRTFRLVEGEPLPTSYGQDTYRRIFGSEPEAAPAAVAGM